MSSLATNRSNAGGAVASVLGLVSTVANTITGTFNALGEGSDILNAYVTKAKQDQATEHKLHRATHTSTAITRAALQQTELKREVNAHLSANPELQQDFSQIHAQLKALFDDGASA